MAKTYLKGPTRIDTVSLLISGRHIKTWRGIFEYIPRTIVATHLGINNNRMKEFVDNPSAMPAEMLGKMAELLKVDVAVLGKLAKKG